jgi:hypothetical protein
MDKPWCLSYNRCETWWQSILSHAIIPRCRGNPVYWASYHIRYYCGHQAKVLSLAVHSRLCATQLHGEAHENCNFELWKLLSFVVSGCPSCSTVLWVMTHLHCVYINYAQSIAQISPQAWRIRSSDKHKYHTYCTQDIFILTQCNKICLQHVGYRRVAWYPTTVLQR